MKAEEDSSSENIKQEVKDLESEMDMIKVRAKPRCARRELMLLFAVIVLFVAFLIALVFAVINRESTTL